MAVIVLILGESRQGNVQIVRPGAVCEANLEGILPQVVEVLAVVVEPTEATWLHNAVGLPFSEHRNLVRELYEGLSWETQACEAGRDDGRIGPVCVVRIIRVVIQEGLPVLLRIRVCLID